MIFYIHMIADNFRWFIFCIARTQDYATVDRTRMQPSTFIFKLAVQFNSKTSNVVGN